MNSLTTRTGKKRLGPLNIGQLTSMLETARPKDKQKIQNRIKILQNKNSKNS